MTDKGKEILNNCFNARLKELTDELEGGGIMTDSSRYFQNKDEIKSIEALIEINETFGLTVS